MCIPTFVYDPMFQGVIIGMFGTLFFLFLLLYNHILLSQPTLNDVMKTEDDEQ